MKTALKISGAIIGCVILLLLILRVTGFEPREDCPSGSSLACRLPGLWLRGNVATSPVTDWSFTDKYQTVKVQTRDRFFLPYSVNAYCVSYNNQLYLTSLYQPGTPKYPHGRHWNENVARDPHVRIKIGDRLFDRTLVYVTDPDEREAVIRNKAKKYPRQIVPPGSFINVFRAVSDDEHASN